MVSKTYNTSTESVTVSATAGGASGNVLYTVPNNNDATIDMLFISNNNTASKKVYVQFYHQDDTTYYNLVNARSVAGNTSYNVLESSHMHLHAGDKIVVYGETTNVFEATISVKQFYNPSRT
tara:strand:- start:1358 stop:1723 length:366 start_codon:yes stop_codon:yes gene_type:complete